MIVSLHLFQKHKMKYLPDFHGKPLGECLEIILTELVFRRLSGHLFYNPVNSHSSGLSTFVFYWLIEIYTMLTVFWEDWCPQNSKLSLNSTEYWIKLNNRGQGLVISCFRAGHMVSLVIHLLWWFRSRKCLITWCWGISNLTAL